MMYGSNESTSTGQQDYAMALQQNSYQGPPTVAGSTQTLMQGLQSDLESLVANARSNLDAIVSQRGRLLGDLPPSPAGNALIEKDRLSGGSISFSDISISLGKLRELLLTANEHLMSMRKIG